MKLPLTRLDPVMYGVSGHSEFFSMQFNSLVCRRADDDVPGGHDWLRRHIRPKHPRVLCYLCDFRPRPMSRSRWCVCARRRRPCVGYDLASPCPSLPFPSPRRAVVARSFRFRSFSLPRRSLFFAFWRVQDLQCCTAIP